MFAHLRTLGANVGITFRDITLLSNSRLALEASEYAKDQGVFDRFHDTMFRAYFNDGKDIGSAAVILEVGEGVGINAGALKKELDRGTYAVRLQEMRRQAENHGVSAVPTFVINSKEKLVGVQPLEVFREFLERQ